MEALAQQLKDHNESRSQQDSTMLHMLASKLQVSFERKQDRQGKTNRSRAHPTTYTHFQIQLAYAFEKHSIYLYDYS